MILGTTDSIEAVLDTATTTTVKYMSSYIDAGNDALGNKVGAINGTSGSTIVAAPSAGYRIVHSINIYNSHTVSLIVTVQLDVSATNYELHKVTLAPGQALSYSDKGGWVLSELGASGIVPSCRAKMSGNLSVATAGTAVAFDFAGADGWDTDTMHDHTAGTATERSKIYAKTAGIFLVTAVGEWSSNNVTGYRILYIYKNGTTLFTEALDDANQNQATGQLVSDVVNLAVNDYIQIFAQQNSGVTLTIAGGNDYSGVATVTWLGRIA